MTVVILSLSALYHTHSKRKSEVWKQHLHRLLGSTFRVTTLASSPAFVLRESTVVLKIGPQILWYTYLPSRGEAYSPLLEWVCSWWLAAFKWNEMEVKVCDFWDKFMKRHCRVLMLSHLGVGQMLWWTPLWRDPTGEDLRPLTNTTSSEELSPQPTVTRLS